MKYPRNVGAYSKAHLDEIVENRNAMSRIICFHDSAMAAEILHTDDVARIKEFGRRVSGYVDSVWGGIRQSVVYEGLIGKFSQNEDLKELLLAMGDAVLAECAVKDRIWGIGLSMKDPDRLDQAKWQGQNLLGFTLMRVRDELAAE